ncbi:MAG: ATP-binding protein [Deltaproteobacteria bacterium]|nr:ATP-binding protein [Deltaproteobacteria bacterium]
MTESEYKLDYDGCRRLLLDRLQELPPGRIQLLTGPRQVGKTTLLLDLAEQLGDAVHYVAADDPQAGLPGFWERMWTEAEMRASRGNTALFIDEIQHIADWAGRIKGQYDRLKRRKIPLHVVATGSYALRLGAGSRETLAGRFERLTLTHWSASALKERFAFSPSTAASVVVRLGSYPGSLQFQNDIFRWRAYVRDSIIEPAIGRDVLALGVVRRPGLLRQIFAVAISMPAQIVSLQKLQGQLHDRGALETVAHYLALLEEAYLVVALKKFGEREHRRRAAPPKLVALNNALLSAMHPQGPPDPNHEPARFGSWVENACLAFAWNSGQRVMYWREEPLEVDGITEGSWGAWAIEIKTGAFDATHLRGLLEFCRRHPRYHPLVVTAPGDEPLARRPGVASVNWSDFLLAGPPAG